LPKVKKQVLFCLNKSTQKAKLARLRMVECVLASMLYTKNALKINSEPF